MERLSYQNAQFRVPELWMWKEEVGRNTHSFHGLNLFKCPPALQVNLTKTRTWQTVLFCLIQNPFLFLQSNCDFFQLFSPILTGVTFQTMLQLFWHWKQLSQTTHSFYVYTQLLIETDSPRRPCAKKPQHTWAEENLFYLLFKTHSWLEFFVCDKIVASANTLKVFFLRQNSKFLKKFFVSKSN